MPGARRSARSSWLSRLGPPWPHRGARGADSATLDPMRRHFPLTFRTKHATEAYLVGVHHSDPDARLVNLRETATGWAACLSTKRPVDGFTGLPAGEGVMPGGASACP